MNKRRRWKGKGKRAARLYVQHVEMLGMGLLRICYRQRPACLKQMAHPDRKAPSACRYHETR